MDITDGLKIIGKSKWIELPDDMAKYYKSLGTATGTGYGHCVYLGNKYKENFMDRVCGYRLIKNDKVARQFELTMKKEYISVEFYEQKVLDDVSDLSEEDIMMIWYFHESEQFIEKLSDKAKAQINVVIRKRKQADPNAEIWEIT